MRCESMSLGPRKGGQYRGQGVLFPLTSQFDKAIIYGSMVEYANKSYGFV